MTYRLRDRLYWCACGGRIIFLDLEADRYFCLPSAPEAAFVRLVGGDMEPGDAERLRGLIRRGMLVEDSVSPGLRGPSSVQAPTGDLLQEPHPPNVGDILTAFVSEARAAWALRTRPFLKVVEGVARARPAPRQLPPDHHERLCRIVSASAAVSLVLRAADRCLVRALALHAICRRHGIRPQLVLGVRVNPFVAHCWVQLDETVLVGDFEQVRLFTPIVAVG